MVARLLTVGISVILFAISASAAEILYTKKPLQILSRNNAKHHFTVEIADTPGKQEQGLMHRKSLRADRGMLFLFAKEIEVNMWMRNTYIPLDIIFIKAGGKISKIVADTTPFSLEEIPSGGKVEAVLELNAGICKKLGINENDKVVF